MLKKQVFCGAEECNVNCPSYVAGYTKSFISTCKLLNAKIKAVEAEEKAYEKMEEYYSLKIEGDK